MSTPGMDRGQLERLLETEREVIGGLMLRPELLWETDLSTEDFYDKKMSAVYAAICELHADGEPVDVLSVESKLNGKHGLRAEVLIEFTNLVTTTEKIPYHATRIKAKALERTVRSKAHQLYTSDAEGQELVTEAHRLLVGLNDNTSSGNAEPVSEVCNEVLAELARRQKGEKPTGLATLVPEFDKFLVLKKGGVLIIAGRPSMGKSTVAQWILEATVGNGDERAIVFTTESHRTEYTTRLLSRLSGVNTRAIEHGEIGWEKTQKVKEASDAVRKWPLWIDDRHLDLPDLVQQIRRAKARHGVTMVVVDHLQEITHRRLRLRDQELINAVLMELRAVCRESPKTYLVILSQLNRAVEKQDEKRPVMANLRASGKIEEVADGVLLLYRKAYYYPLADESILEGAWAKNRNGPTGTMEFSWDDINGHCAGPIASAWGAHGKMDDNA